MARLASKIKEICFIGGKSWAGGSFSCPIYPTHSDCPQLKGLAYNDRQKANGPSDPKKTVLPPTTRSRLRWIFHIRSGGHPICRPRDSVDRPVSKNRVAMSEVNTDTSPHDPNFEQSAFVLRALYSQPRTAFSLRLKCNPDSTAQASRQKKNIPDTGRCLQNTKPGFQPQSVFVFFLVTGSIEKEYFSQEFV